MTADLGWWTKNFGDRPEIFVHQLDIINDKVLLVRLDTATKQAASFLDQRALTPETKGVWLSWDQLLPHIPQNQAPRMIFHIGHCGSTLVSRLIDALATPDQPVTGLREPLPFRTLATEQLEGSSALWSKAIFEQRLKALLQLYGREPGLTIIKTTSICNGLIDNVLGAGVTPAFMYLKLEPYLAAMLGGENSSIDLRGFATMRHRRLAQKIGSVMPLGEMSFGELAGMSWLTEMLDGHSTGAQVIKMDFEAFLSNPGPALSALAGHFGIVNDAAAIQKALTSGIMSRYAKSQDYQYTADTRAKNLAASRRENASEISAGLKWVEALAASHPEINAVSKLIA